METDRASSKKIIINYGILLGIVSTALGIVLYTLGTYTDPHWIFSVLGFLILIGIIGYGIKTFKTQNNGYLILTDALKIGIGIALIGGIIGALWSVVLTTVIEPDYTQQVLETQRIKMIETYPDFSKEQIDQSMSIVEKFSSPFVSVAISIIGNLFFGFIISMIVGLIMQKKEELH
ncbi:DUF4199 domain-containing protein [Aquimarina sp. 2201CG1-2-11]|uniref:DUF4199 domain-containing protein n=1 Tax=Aquimarina discodermiae TaxID=3231043 RepID=UPI003462EFD8